MDAYNYSVFDLRAEAPAFESFQKTLHVGERAPGGVLEDLINGDSVTLKSLWLQGPAILEFGSFT